MTRGQIIFLVMIICSAIVTGTTIGIVSNFDIIAQQAQISLEKNADGAAADSVPPINEYNQVPPADHLTVASNNPVSRSSQLMVVTTEEKEEIRSMLRQLGMSEQQQETEFIREFQQSHSLDATGNLDSQTLNLMIKQATYNKASRAVNSQ